MSYYPTDIGAALFTQKRERNGGLVDFELKPNDKSTLDLSGFYSKLDAPQLQPQLSAVEDALRQFRGRAGPDRGLRRQNGTLTNANFAGVPGTLYGVYDQISRPDESATANFVNLDGHLQVNDTLSFARHRSAPRRATARRRPRMCRRRNPDLGTGAGYTLHGIGSGPTSTSATPTTPRRSPAARR